MSKVLSHKIDFEVLVSVRMSNPNGDPLNGNRPREDYLGYGEISDVCVKRKIRNAVQDLGQDIFVQSDGRQTDGYTSLKARADGCKELKAAESKKNPEEYIKIACDKWFDVRSFGQVFAFKGSNLSVGITGPVTVQQGISVGPIIIRDLQISKSTNGEEKESKSSDTLGFKSVVEFGLYVIRGSINANRALKTGFTENDASLIKTGLLMMFENDGSSSRPAGGLVVEDLFWWSHKTRMGELSSSKVFSSVKVEKKAGIEFPRSYSDYIISVEELPGIQMERF